MANNDHFRLATEDVSALKGQVLARAELSNDAADGHVAARALANALIFAVQQYLEQNSNEHDVDLFMEVNGAQPADVDSWPVNIIAGLRFRAFPEEDRLTICASAVDEAVNLVRSSSPLAWGR
jgi:hypothetical protein